jgi:hypothetical protein
MRTRLVLALLALASTAVAQPAPQRVGWRELAANPSRYVGKTIEIAAVYCASDEKGGFDCSTDGPVHIAAASIGPERARRKIDAECGGLDVIEHSAFCRARMRLTPTSFRIGTEPETSKTITILATGTAELAF